MTRARLTLLFLLALFAAGVSPTGSASAAGPIISGTSGPLQHGGTLVLTGSGFSVHPDFHADTDKLVRVFDDKRRHVENQSLRHVVGVQRERAAGRAEYLLAADSGHR